MNKRTKACDISAKTKKIVWERDNERCIICGNPEAMPNAHYIRRSQCGLGIPENVVTLCINCHHEFDNGSGRERIGSEIKDYLKRIYPEWREEDLVYNKWQWLKEVKE